MCTNERFGELRFKPCASTVRPTSAADVVVVVPAVVEFSLVPEVGRVRKSSCCVDQKSDAGDLIH